MNIQNCEHNTECRMHREEVREKMESCTMWIHIKRNVLNQQNNIPDIAVSVI